MLFINASKKECCQKRVAEISFFLRKRLKTISPSIPLVLNFLTVFFRILLRPIHSMIGLQADFFR